MKEQEYNGTVKTMNLQVVDSANGMDSVEKFHYINYYNLNFDQIMKNKCKERRGKMFFNLDHFNII
jgi:hypothetical protein